MHLPLAVRLAEEFLLDYRPWPKGWAVDYCARVDTGETRVLLQRMFVECPFYGVRAPAWKGAMGYAAEWTTEPHHLWSAWALGDYRVSKLADPEQDGVTVRLQKLAYSPAARPQVRAIAGGRVG